MNNTLNEDSRSKLISNSKSGAKYAENNRQYGKNRFQRRLRSKVSHSVKDYNSINMDRLFRDDILDVSLEVKGETDTYHVKISFFGFLEELHKVINKDPSVEITLRLVTRALLDAFNRDDVYIGCSCADFIYRMNYWATQNKLTTYTLDKTAKNSKATPDEDNDQQIPANITNPTDDKGPGCKHIMLVLSNNTWLIKVSSVVTNYIKYMRNHEQQAYADIIYPAIYETQYTEPVQLGMNPSGRLKTDTDVLDVANKWARTKTQFQRGNKYRFKPLDDLEGQMPMFSDDSEVSDTTANINKDK